jgi:hypothetical protein
MKFSIITVLMLSLSAAVCAQNLEAGRGEGGVILYYHGPLPLGGEAEIVRTDQSGQSKSFKIYPSKNEKEVFENSRNIPAVHKFLNQLDKDGAAHVWKMLQSAKNTTDINMFRLPSVAFGCGLALRDSTAKITENYSYQLLVNEQKLGSAVKVNANEDTKLYSPVKVGRSTKDASVRMGWIVPKESQLNLLGFVTYRSEPLAEKYSPLITLQGFQNQTDSLIATVRDTTTHLVGSWNYVIRLVDRFGAVGPPSQPIMAHNYPPESLPRVVKFKAKGQSNLPAVNLSWRVENAFRVRNLKLYRSRFADKNYELIKELAPTDTSTVDYIVDVMEAYFYFIEIGDIGGEENLRSVMTPAISQYKTEAFPVSEIEAAPKEKGILVTWRGHIPNDRGYYVLRMEGFSDSLKIISNFIPASTDTAVYSYLDKDASLRGDRNYTYGVMSESHGYLKSEVLLTASARPNIPIHVPVAQSLRLRPHDDESGYSLSWQHVSNSEYNNLFGYRVYYRKNPNSNYIEFTTHLILPDTNWIELPVFTPETEWAVKTFDVFGNESDFSNSVKVNNPFYYDFGPKYLRAEPLENVVELRWNNTSPERITGFKLYRTDGKNEPELIKGFKPDELSFNVELPDDDIVHYYQIVAFDKHNAPSTPSEWVIVSR